MRPTKSKAKNHKVTLIEKHKDLGGRARVFKRNGFTFDGGPTVITAPHLIHELLPPKGDGHRWINADPVTGQAAWFDLRVKIEKFRTPKTVEPSFGVIKSPVGKGLGDLLWKVGK